MQTQFSITLVNREVGQKYWRIHYKRYQKENKKGNKWRQWKQNNGLETNLYRVYKLVQCKQLKLEKVCYYNYIITPKILKREVRV